MYSVEQINLSFGMNNTIPEHLLSGIDINLMEFIKFYCDQLSYKIIYASLGIILCYLVYNHLIPLLKKIDFSSVYSSTLINYFHRTLDFISSLADSGILFFALFISAYGIYQRGLDGTSIKLIVSSVIIVLLALGYHIYKFIKRPKKSFKDKIKEAQDKIKEAKFEELE